MGLRDLVHVAGACLGVLVVSSVANAAAYHSDLEISAGYQWPSGLTDQGASLVGGWKPAPGTSWTTQSNTPDAIDAALEAQTASWVAAPNDTAGGLHLELGSWAAIPDVTSGLHVPLQLARQQDSPVPLPASFWLFGSGALAALALFARRPAVPHSDLSRQFRAR
jgi:hypothetical protein